MKADQAFATLSGQPASKRHVDSVNFSACADCHGTEWESTYHKGQYGIGFVMSEQVSHTNDAAGKPIIGIDGCATCHSHTGISNPWSAKFGLALEIRVHKTHAEKAFGLIGGNCTQCHNDFNLDAFKVKGAMEFNRGSYTTPITATCTSCHTVGTDYFKAHTKEQLEKYGAVIDGDFTLATQAAQSETCLFCHKPTAADHTQWEM
ncbi:MAG: multiheme c-type cytochrome, partial [Shewanella sp.]